MKIFSAISEFLGNALSVIGNLLTGLVDLANDIQNSTLFERIGDFANAIGLAPIHRAADAIVDGVYRIVDSIGVAFGGTSTYESHYEREWSHPDQDWLL
ncbi:hypothetical protein KXS07_36515 [Inquilinus limosus]|uniref:hypothetical protein n=1 Tax=Inquilinus limosus TaxID=171674 RepID=UPI003F16853C